MHHVDFVNKHHISFCVIVWSRRIERKERKKKVKKRVRVLVVFVYFAANGLRYSGWHGRVLFVSRLGVILRKRVLRRGCAWFPSSTTTSTTTKICAIFERWHCTTRKIVIHAKEVNSMGGARVWSSFCSVFIFMGNDWSVNINEVMWVLFYAVLFNLRAECACKVCDHEGYFFIFQGRSALGGLSFQKYWSYVVILDFR